MVLGFQKFISEVFVNGKFPKILPSENFPLYGKTTIELRSTCWFWLSRNNMEVHSNMVWGFLGEIDRTDKDYHIENTWESSYQFWSSGHHCDWSRTDPQWLTTYIFPIWIKTTIIIPATFVFVIDFVNYVNIIIWYCIVMQVRTIICCIW